MDGRAGWVVNEGDSDVMDEEVDLDWICVGRPKLSICGQTRRTDGRRRRHLHDVAEAAGATW